MILRFLQTAEIDIFAFLVLFIVLVSSHRRSENSFINYRIFTSMVILTMIQLLLETLIWFIDGTSWSRNLSFILNSLYYGLNPIPPMLWAAYTIHQLYDNHKKTALSLKLLSIPVFITFILLLVNLFTPIVFYIDSTHHYKNLTGIIFIAAICFLYILFSITLVISRYKKVNKSKFYALLLFSIPPILGGLLDMLFTELSTLWPGIVISLLFVYIKLQREREITDCLTGLYNRRELDEYLDKKVREASIGRLFSIIMIDIDDFKIINDTYGHTAGDLALEKVANIISKSLRLNDFVARYAGDEFVAIVNSSDYDQLITIVGRIKGNLKIYNEKSDIKLSLSIGYSVYKKGSDMKPNDFLKSVDELMYRDKRTKKGGLKPLF